MSASRYSLTFILLGHSGTVFEAIRNKCIASSNKCLTSSNKKLLETSASLLVTSALLVVTRSHYKQVYVFEATSRLGLKILVARSFLWNPFTGNRITFILWDGMVFENPNQRSWAGF